MMHQTQVAATPDVNCASGQLYQVPGLKQGSVELDHPLRANKKKWKWKININS